MLKAGSVCSPFSVSLAFSICSCCDMIFTKCKTLEESIVNKEMKDILNMSNEEKYDYFIEKVIETEKVWILRDDEGCASLDDKDAFCLPMWPEKDFADQCISGEWANYMSESIALEVLMDRWLPGLSEDGIRLTILWMDGKGVEVSAGDLLEDLKAELEEEETE